MTVYSSYSDTASALTLFASGAPMQPRLFLLQPEVVFAARVRLLDPAEYPISFVAYDTVTTGAYTDIKPGMTILLGSVAGGDQYGRQRVRGPETPATAISIFVGRSSQGTFDGELTIVDDAYITVLDLRMVFAKMPFIDDVGGIFKDSSLEVEWRTTTPPPVANLGQGFAGTIDSVTGVMPVAFNGQLSFAVADGATITDYLWDIKDGALTGGSLATDDNITTTFPPGFRYVELMVTDSNGKTHTACTPVYARDPDDDTSFDGFAIESHRIADSGQTMTIRALQDMPRATYPDGTLAMIWGREPSGEGDRTHMLIVGWLDIDDASHNAGRTGLLRDTTLTIQDVAARLDTLPGFPQSVADDETRDTELIPEITWNYMIAPTMDKYIHYLLAWHSTALEVADFIWSGTGDAYAIAIKSSDGESLWNQVSRTAQQMCPGYVLTCDQAGRMAVVPDPQLQDLADRTATVQTTIVEDNWSDLRFTYQRAPRTHWLRTGALVVQASITFNAPIGDAPPTVFLPTVFSISPGSTPGQGLGEVDNNEQLAASQAVLNAATGHRYARMNAATGLLTVTLIQDDGGAGSLIPWREIEPAHKEWVEFTLSAANAAQRGLTFTAVRCLPKEVNVRYNHSRTGLTRTIEVTLEVETSGQPGATVVKPTNIPAPGDDPAVIPDPIPPPDFGLRTGQELVAGIGETSLYRTADFQTDSGSGGPTWEEITLTGSDVIQTFVVDPFSPGYLTGTGTIDGWVATDEKIYRISDIFGTVITTPIVTFATTALWRTIQASFGTYFVEGSNPWLICISYYGNAAGHTGTWCTYSKDGGATWAAEVLVSSFYDSGGASNPIGLYCSPKTPGLAYTVAHTETANPATTTGYVSHDWGATWSAMLADDPATPLPLWAIIDATADVIDSSALSASVAKTITIQANPGTTGIQSTHTYHIVLAPPENAVRVEISGTWTHTVVTSNPGFTSNSQNYSETEPASIDVATDMAFNSAPTSGGSHTQDYTLTWTRASGTEWEGNREDFEVDLPTDGAGYCHWTMVATASRVLSTTVDNTLSHSATVTEIELEGDVIYTPASGAIVPIHGQGGEIHLPWPDNDDESIFYYGSLDRTGSPVIGLQRAEAGTVTDISKTVYGINSGHFAIRTHDLDRQFALLAGESEAGNSGVWTSVDAGDNWDEIVTPSAVTPYQAAFGGDSEDIIFVWGPAEYITYSDDFGVSVDDRSGNLAALSATKLIGIAGGPTP